MMLDTSVLLKPRLRQFVMIIGYLPSMYIMLPKLISASDPHRLLVPVYEMTYTVSSGTWNSTKPYHTIPYHTIPYHTIPCLLVSAAYGQIRGLLQPINSPKSIHCNKISLL